jgi:hypothetical protein
MLRRMQRAAFRNPELTVADASPSAVVQDRTGASTRNCLWAAGVWPLSWVSRLCLFQLVNRGLRQTGE